MATTPVPTPVRRRWKEGAVLSWLKRTCDWEFSETFFQDVEVVDDIIYHINLISIYLSIYLSIHLSIYLCIYLYTYIGIHLIINLSFPAFFCQSFPGLLKISTTLDMTCERSMSVECFGCTIEALWAPVCFQFQKILGFWVFFLCFLQYSISGFQHRQIASPNELWSPHLSRPFTQKAGMVLAEIFPSCNGLRWSKYNVVPHSYTLVYKPIKIH